MVEISWIYGLLGGLLIGTAAAIYLLGNGLVMGISGILGGLLDGSGRSNWQERLAFVAGLAGLPFVASFFVDMPGTNATASLGILVMAGLLVGFGTRLGSGCTSGHGICGIPRLSVRSIVATITYIFAGAVMILAARQMGVL